jgi:acylphosphatase
MALPEGHKAELVRITGRVQGVWYRGWTIDNALALGLTGWVRNRLDGSVEALFVGPAEAVDEMIEACRRGPPAARVEAVERTPSQASAGEGFVHKPTA